MSMDSLTIDFSDIRRRMDFNNRNSQITYGTNNIGTGGVRYIYN